MGQTLEVYEIGVRDRASGVDVMRLSEEKLEYYWPEFEPILHEFAHHFRLHTMESIRVNLFSSVWQAWIVFCPKIHLLIITTVEVYPAAKVLRVVWTYGKLNEDIKPVVNEAMEQFAREHECSWIDVNGRPGWEPLLKAWGFEKQAVVFSRPVLHRSMQ